MYRVIHTDKTFMVHIENYVKRDNGFNSVK